MADDIKPTWDDRLAVVREEVPDGYTVYECRAENRQRVWKVLDRSGAEVVTKVADRESKVRSLVDAAWEHEASLDN